MYETSSVSASMLAAMIELRVSMRHHAFLKAGLNINRCGTVFRTIRTFAGCERNEVHSRKKAKKPGCRKNRAKLLGYGLVSLIRVGGMVMVEVQVRCCPRSLSDLVHDFCSFHLFPY